MDVPYSLCVGGLGCVFADLAPGEDKFSSSSSWVVAVWVQVSSGFGSIPVKADNSPQDQGGFPVGRVTMQDLKHRVAS